MTLQTVEEATKDLGSLGEGIRSPEKWSNLLEDSCSSLLIHDSTCFSFHHAACTLVCDAFLELC